LVSNEVLTLAAQNESERIQFITNVDTLTKSRTNAQEERLEREKEREMQGAQVTRFMRSRPTENAEDQMIEDYYDMSHIAQDRRISLERYLMYCNPHVKSFPTQTFVAGALSTGRLLQILPSFAEAHRCLNRSDNNIGNEIMTRFHFPNTIEEERTKMWTEQIKDDVQRKRDERTNPDQILYPNIFRHQERHLHNNGESRIDYERPDAVPLEVQLERVISDVAIEQRLNTEQERCYSLFLNGLRSQARTESTVITHNRCMYLGGPGGTGKSRVIQAIVTLFRRIGCSDKLVVSATTGIAANIIHGSTIHSVCHLSRGNQTNEDGNREDRNRQLNLDNSWTNCEFLIIDEVSMLGCKGLNEISVNLCKLKACVQPFGGLYVLFSGDLHQLPCIGDKCLYIDIRKEVGKVGTSVSSTQKAYMLGAQLWENVTSTTVLLTEHYRAPDKTVHEVLDRIRRGCASATDIDLIHSRTFGHIHGPNPTDVKWQTAPLITPRNAVRQAWNNQAGLRYAVQTGSQIFISPSRDSGVPAGYSREEMIWAIDSSTEMLATWGMLCIGAVAIVTTNVAVELGIANGTEVIIREVVPHSNDIEGWRQIHNQIVRLSQPPICVFVEPTDTSINSNREFRQGQPRWFPIMTRTQRVQSPKDSGTTKTFMRTQIPLTHAFALSDHKVQGKGLPKSILDLQKPPSGHFTLENFYTMLSRTSDWDDMAILRAFNDDIFKMKPDERLTKYGVYLKDQNEKTKRRYEQEISS